MTRKARIFAAKAAQYGKAGIIAGNEPFMEMMARDIGAALEFSDDPRCHALLKDLTDEGVGKSASALFRKHGFTLRDLHRIWEDHMRVIGFHCIYKMIPEAMEKLAQGASERKVVCPGCEGAQEIKGKGGEMYDCPECDGRGWVHRPDKDAVNRFMQATKLIVKEPVVQLDLRGAVEDNIDDLERIDRMNAITVRATSE